MKLDETERKASIRRRIPSYQQGDDEEQGSSIRIVHAPSLRGEKEVLQKLTTTNQQRLYRKPVPEVANEEEEEEEEDKEERVIIQSGNILMQQAAIQAHHQRSAMSGNTVLLPSPLEYEIDFNHDGKLGWNKRISKDESDRKYNDEDEIVLEAWPDEGISVEETDKRSLMIRSSNAFITEKLDILTNSNRAQNTLHDLSQSLQWTLKFPQGTHLSRAKSRSTIRSETSKRSMNEVKASGNLTEARAGLRLLAKKREDLIQDHEDKEANRVAAWNIHKLALLLSVLLVLALGVLGLIVSLLTWGNAWKGAELKVIVDTDIIILMTVASSLCLATSMVGLSGSMLNSRPILALYAFLLWPALLSILTVGYTSYKRANLRLDLKLNQTWSRYLDDLARLRIQEVLQCCGYYTPLHQATFSRQCYPRTTLPGCKGPLYRFERTNLWQLYTITFSAVFFHLLAIAASVLCSNHVNVTFGKGLTPRSYRLDVSHVRRNAIGIIEMLSENKDSNQLKQQQQLTYQQHLHVDHSQSL